ncbi:MAG TPA: hypothetical protein VNJ12_04655, partial [Candidatus Dormibacteraeota bacterium]|nr:hypothetical protein [Candidatus Dormibacteraeota bacterium]
MNAPSQHRPRIWNRAWFVLLIHFISFAAFAFIAFRTNPHALFSQEDGVHWRLLANEQFLWEKFQLGVPAQIFESIGNIRFPVNFHLMPEFVLPAMLDGGRIRALPVFTLLACTMFLATYLLSRTIGFRVSASLAAAWGLLLLAAPFFSEGLVYPMFSLGPPFAWNLTMTALIISLFWRIGRTKYALIEIAALTVVTFWVAIANPGMLAISGPVIAVFGIAAMVSAKDRREFLVKLGSCLVVLALAYFSGLIDFVLGIFLHTASADFRNEIILPFPPHSLDQASLLYHHRSFGPAGPLLFALGVGGAIRAVMTGPWQQRVLGSAVLFSAIAYAGFGAAVILFTSYAAVTPVYYDYVTLPFYVIFAVDFVSASVAWGNPCLTTWARIPWPPTTTAPGMRARVIVCLFLAAGPWLLFPTVIATRHTPNYLFPPSETPIVARLKSAIGLTPGAVYRGRVMSAFKLADKAPQNWMQLSAFGDHLWTSTGNDHQFDGLWWYGIPTLFEYNWLVSPFFYRVTRDILARPDDPRMRNVVTLRKVDPTLLRLFGVRYVIADTPLPAPAHLVLTQSVEGDPVTLYLYEFDNVNLGNYSPTKLVPASDADAALKLIRSGSDLSRVAALEDPPAGPLVPASSVRIFVEKDGLRLDATSAQTSLILLPFEYSHCLTLEPISQDGTPPRL